MLGFDERQSRRKADVRGLARIGAVDHHHLGLDGEGRESPVEVAEPQGLDRDVRRTGHPGIDRLEIVVAVEL